MRKASAILLVLCLLISLCACEGPVNPTQSNGPTQNSDPTQNKEPTQSSTPTDPSQPTAPSEPSYPTEPSNPECAHRDDNADKLCDDCQKSVVVTIDFYNINDLHGKFADLDAKAGVDELTTYLKNAQKSDDYTVFLSTGDMWLGSPESNNTTGRIVTDWMNHMGFVSMTLGNHEYDWRENGVKVNAELAEFPMLGINVFDKNTGKHPDYCQSSVMVERGGVKIGIIGSMGDSFTSISADFISEVSFVSGSALTKLVKEESEKLRAQGADVIIYALHDGIGEGNYNVESISDSKLSQYYDPTLSSGGYVDLAFEGHTHYRYTWVDSYGVYHLQAGSDSAGVSHVEMTVNLVTGEKKMDIVEFVSSSQYVGLADDPIVQQLLEKYNDEISDAYRVLGTNGRYRNSDALRAIGAQVYYEAGLERWGQKCDIVFGGGFLSVRSPYDLAAGDVTYADLEALFPFDNELVLCSIKGRDLRSKYFNSSNKNVFIHCGEYGQWVEQNIDLNATYYVVVDSYSSTYAYNNLTEIERYTPGIYLRDLIADYIRAGRMEN